MKWFAGSVLVALLFAAGFWLNSSLRLERGAERYSPSPRVESGTEIVMVYLSSASCAACNDPELPQLVEAIKLALSARAAKMNIGFAALGVGIDWSTSASLGHIARFGEFDELVVGRSWLNSAALKYALHEHVGVPEVPQIVVIQRKVKAPPDQVYGVSEELVVGRYVTQTELLRWLRNNLPLARRE